MKRLFKSFIICLFILIFVVTPLAAAFTAIISVVESSGNSYDMVASNITANVDYMADDAYLGTSTGLDTRVQEGTASIPHMLVEDRILFANDLPAFASRNYNFTTDNAPLSAFNIIGGFNSSVNLTDAANIEHGANFTDTFNGYFATTFSDNYTDRNIINKPGAFKVYVSSAENITAAIGSGVPDATDLATSFATMTAESTTGGSPAFTINDLITGAYYWETNVALPEWLMADFGTAQYQVITYTLQAGDSENVRMPKDWTFQGSTDNSSWDTLDTQAGITFALSQKRTYNIVNANGYRYYRWNISAITGGGAVRIFEVELFSQTVSVSATGITSGEHEVITGTDNNSLYLGIGVDTNVNDADFPITDNLVFNAPLWHTELNSSPFTTKDSTEFSCTVTGATWNANSGRLFDGNDDIDIDTLRAAISTNTTGTIVVWVNLTDATPVAINAIVAFGDTNAVEILEMRVQTDGVAFAQCLLGGVVQWVLDTDAPAFSDDTFAHFALVQDGVSPVIYINGVAPPQAFSTATNKTRWFSTLAGVDNGYIGTRSVAGAGKGNYLTGVVGEMRYYYASLSSSELLADYNATKWKYDSTITNTPFYYNLLGGSVLDTANNYVLLQNNVMPYADNVIISIGGTQQLWFEPNDIIALSGINGILPDRQGGDNPGTITFGSNPAGIALSLGALISDYSGTIIDTTETPSFVPAGITPQPTATAVKEAALVAHPFYPWVSAFNTTTTVGILFQFQFIYIAGALFAFSGTFTWIRNMFLSGGLFVAVIGLGVTQSVFDWWVLLLVIPVWIGLTIMENRQTI